MSSLHMDSSWISTSQQLEQKRLIVDDKVCPMFLIKKRYAGFIHSVFEHISLNAVGLVSTFQMSEDLLFKYLSSCLDPKENEIARNYKLNFPSSVYTKITQQMGISFDEQKQAYQKIEEAALQFFAKVSKEFAGKKIVNHKERVNELFEQAKIDLRKLWNSEVIATQIEISEEERVFLGLKPDQLLPKLDALDCAGYAFLRIKEERAIRWIKSSKCESGFYDKAIEILLNWNYRLVTSPCAGDLMVYFNDESGKLAVPKATHVGVLLENGMVESKYGTTEKSISHHNVTEVPAQYGNILMCFRKNHLYKA